MLYINIRKIVSVILSTVMAFVLCIGPAYAADNTSAIIMSCDTIRGADITKNMAPDELDIEARDFELVYTPSLGCRIRFSFLETLIDFNVVFGYANEEKTWIAGYSDNTNAEYTLTNFKIDKDGYAATLMTPNHALAGSPVLSFAFESQTGEIFYFQLSVSASELEYLEQYCVNPRTRNSTDFNELYRTYLTGRSPEKFKFEGTRDLDSTINDTDKSSKIAYKPILERFPEEYFKGSLMNEVIYDQDGSMDIAYCSSRFIGTDNVLTGFVAMDQDYDPDYTNQEFWINYTLAYNTAVVYNPDADTFDVWDPMENGYSVYSPTVIFEVQNSDGCVLRISQYAYISGNNARKIASVLLHTVPYLGTGVELYEELTSTEANTDISYGASKAEQLEDFNGLLQEVTVTAKTFEKIEDHIVLDICSAEDITDAEARYSFEVSF